MNTTFMILTPDRPVGLYLNMFDSKQGQLPTKDRLVHAAAGLLLRQSYGTVSVDDICKSADVKKGTFYHHFLSKSDLALAAYEYMWQFARTMLEPCFSLTLPPMERLKKYAEVSYAFQNDLYVNEGKIYGCPISSAGHEMGAQDERIRIKTKEIFDHYVGYFEGVVRDLPAYLGASDDKVSGIACEMFSYVLGILYQAKVANDPSVIARDLFPGLKRLAGEGE